MKTLLAASLLATLPFLAACGSDDTTATDDPASPTTDASTTGSTRTDFGPTSYSYTLKAACFCAFIEPVRITVEDDAIASAVVAHGGRGFTKGQDAPEALRLTIDDLLAKAADPEVDQVDLDWPDGQDYPSSIALDPIKNAVDDEVTYYLSDVTVTGG
ncbi:DUF6174 domain-containing protein [Nocardioides panacisoli]|uniref:Lipoprotein n=1 Tax=Nocardioides panacisoli TaxID=627624 RepID=A0ABP7ITH8_9ACTN